MKDDPVEQDGLKRRRAMTMASFPEIFMIPMPPLPAGVAMAAIVLSSMAHQWPLFLRELFFAGKIMSFLR